MTQIQIEAPDQATTGGGNFFRRVTDPQEFIQPWPASFRRDLIPDPAKTIDQALARTNPVLDGKGTEIGRVSTDYQLMLASRIRALMSTLGRAPSREEALADLLITAHPDWTLDQLMALGAKDPQAVPALLSKHLAPRVKATRPVPAPPAPAPAAPPAPAATPPAATPPAATPPAANYATIGTVMGRLRIPLASYVMDDAMVVLVQPPNGLSWHPEDFEDATVFRIAIEGHEPVTTTWSGVSYTLPDGCTHTVFIREQ